MNSHLKIVCYSNDVFPQYDLSREMESLQKRMQGELLEEKWFNEMLSFPKNKGIESHTWDILEGRGC